MKKLMIVTLALLSLNSFAATKLTAESVELFQVLSNREVADCINEAPALVDVSIEKEIFRCPGCHTYKISGKKKNIDTPSKKKTVITIKGKAVPATFGFVQTYTCDVK